MPFIIFTQLKEKKILYAILDYGIANLCLLQIDNYNSLGFIIDLLMPQLMPSMLLHGHDNAPLHLERLEDLLQNLIDDQELIPFGEELLFHKERYREAREQLCELLRRSAERDGLRGGSCVNHDHATAFIRRIRHERERRDPIAVLFDSEV